MEIIHELVDGMSKEELVTKFNQLGVKAYIVKNMDDARNIVSDIPEGKRDEFLASMIFCHADDRSATVFFVNDGLTGYCYYNDENVSDELEELLEKKLKDKISDWLIDTTEK